MVVFSVLLSPVTPSSEVPLPDAFVHSNATRVGHVVVDASSFPAAFSAITLSFGGHACFPSLESGMARPRQFPQVLNTAYIVMIVMYLSVAISGYYAFGDQTLSPILSNLPQGASVMGAMNNVLKLLTAVSVMSSYPVLMNVLVRELEDGAGIVPGMPGYFLARTLLRLACVAGTCVVAVYMPYFPQFMTLVGAACLAMIVFVCPVVFDIRLRVLRGQTVSWARLAVAVVIAATGLLGGGIGAQQAVQELSSAIHGHAPGGNASATALVATSTGSFALGPAFGPAFGPQIE